jgi:hypothetical protein
LSPFRLLFDLFLLLNPPQEQHPSKRIDRNAFLERFSDPIEWKS